MNPHKILVLDHPFFCDRTKRLYLEHPLAKDMRSMKDIRAALIENKDEVIAFLEGDEKEYNNWLRRSVICTQLFDLAMLGGDLYPTDEWRVLEGAPVFHGTKEECLNYIDGATLKFLKDGDFVERSSNYNSVVTEDGRVAKSIKEARKDCILERKYVDEVDDLVFWHSEDIDLSRQ